MEKKSVFGITTSTIINWEDKFDAIITETEDGFYQSKEEFVHKEDGLTFKYRMCIEYTLCEGEMFYQLQLVPSPSSLYPTKLESVCDCCGRDTDECDYYDVASYGDYVPLGTESIDEDKLNNETDKQMLDLIASVFETINSLRGFYLDKPYNAIGTSGWDLLEDFINGENFIQKTLKKWAK